MSITKLLLITVSCLITATNAQYPYRRRRSFGSAIAGAIVGAIALLLMICLVCLLMRRRRARGNVGGIGPQPGFVSKPMFGGPWNRSNVVPPQNGAPTSPYIHHGNPNSSQAPSQSYNPEYPPRNTPLPPPAYEKDAEYKGEYQPPAGPPPQGQGSDNPYAPPPGPPPAAHIVGQDNGFIGGFRS